MAQYCVIWFIWKDDLEAGWWMVVMMDRPPSASFLSVVSRCMAVVLSNPEVGSSGGKQGRTSVWAIYEGHA